jgi:hypothetical protein
MPVSPESLLSEFENDPSLFEPGQLSLRLEVLDRLDAWFPQIDRAPASELAARARRLRARLEAANAELYASIQQAIRKGTAPALFAGQLEPLSTQPTGLQYDHLDELVAGVFAFPEPGPPQAPTGPENVFYQPTPARHIFALIRQAAITPGDVLVDLGAGLGHVPLLASVSTSARATGIEFEPAYVAAARSCAQKLNLDRVRFLLEDARDTDLSAATVVYLYTPFKGSILRKVLDNLRTEAIRRTGSATHPFRIATFGPCTQSVALEPWLVPGTPPAEDQITVFLPTKQTR